MKLVANSRNVRSTVAGGGGCGGSRVPFWTLWAYCFFCNWTLSSCSHCPHTLDVNPGFALESWIPSPLLPLRLEAPTYMQHYLSSPCLDRHGLSMPGTDKSIPFLTSFWKSQEMGSLVLEGLRRGLKLVTSRPPSQRDPTWFGNFGRPFSFCMIMLLYIYVFLISSGSTHNSKI